MGEMLLLKPQETSEFINETMIRPETIELEYKLRMTRSFADDEIRARFGENLVDRFLEMEKKKQRYRDSHHSVLPPNFLTSKLNSKFIAHQKHHTVHHQQQIQHQQYLRSQMNSSLSTSMTSNLNSSHSISSPRHHPCNSSSLNKSQTHNQSARSISAAVSNRCKSHLGGYNEDNNDDDEEMIEKTSIDIEKSYDPNDRSKFVHSAPIIGNRVKFSSSTTTTRRSEKDDSRLLVSRKQQHQQTIEENTPPMSPINVVQEEKFELNDASLRTLDKSERDRLYASLADLKAKLKRIDDTEAKVIPQSAHSGYRSVGTSSSTRRRQDTSSAMISSASGAQEVAAAELRNDKTITRILKPQSNKSMSLDKWIEVHKRRSASLKSASGKRRKSKVQNQNDKLKQLNEKLKARIAQHKSSSVGLPDDESDRKSSQQSTREAKRFRSRRELIDLTVLDRIQAQIRGELEENLKNLRKLETQNEFNAIVARIREFLLASSSDLDRSSSSNFTSPTILPHTRASSVRVYEYNLFNKSN